MARPTDYSKELLVKARHYIDNYKDYDDIVPSVAGLSVALGVARSTIYDWAGQEDKKEFSDMLQEILSTQEKKLLTNGLKGKFTPTITKLMLAKHGYSDRSEVDTTHHGEVTFTNDVPRPKQ